MITCYCEIFTTKSCSEVKKYYCSQNGEIHIISLNNNSIAQKIGGANEILVGSKFNLCVVFCYLV